MTGAVAAAELRAVERLHVKAWPALETACIDGWLWRHSGGGSQRANSVSTLDFTGDEAARALDRIEALYRAKGAPARVHTFDAGAPPGLDAMLIARGYVEGEATVTMVKPVGPQTPPPDVEASDAPGAEWREVYLGAITESRRRVNAMILAGIPEPRAFFVCRRGGRVISTALGVAEGGHAVVECVATRSDARRSGGAEAVLRALEAWAARQKAHTLGLQVAAGNEPAIALYCRLGFDAVCINRFWVRDSR
jgi:ribosomal protein S18 acetylase RimI-like enzyme